VATKLVYRIIVADQKVREIIVQCGAWISVCLEWSGM